MISVIICSKDLEASEKLEMNVSKTIKTDFEVVIIDNSKNSYSIFEAYNLGISKSRGEIICFLHEDIKIHTVGWGKIILRIFNSRPDIGAVGVAGSKFRTTMPSPWWQAPEDCKSINILQHLNEEDLVKVVRWNYGFDEETEEVGYIDGVFIAMAKKNNLKFNEQIQGFHNYDSDISLQCRLKGLKVLVTNSILIEHYSLGVLDKNWYQSTLQFHNIYANKIKVNLYKSPKICHEWETKNGADFVKGLFNYHFYIPGLRYWIKLMNIERRMKVHFKIVKSIFLN
jgi:glycosyltransferase involved in cell wall biosynthesis